MMAAKIENDLDCTSSDSEYFSCVSSLSSDSSFEESSSCLTKEPSSNLTQELDAIQLYDIKYRAFTLYMELNNSLHLSNIGLFLDSVEYDPERCAALIIKHMSPAATIKVYPNHRVFVQAFNRETAERALKKYFDELQEFNLKSSVQEKAKTNVINASFTMPFRLDLHKVKKLVKSFYKPRQYPFLFINPKETGIKCAVFPTGYALVMLSNSYKDTKNSITVLIEVLCQCIQCSSNTPDDAFEKSNGDISYKLFWENEFEHKRPDELFSDGIREYDNPLLSKILPQETMVTSTPK